MQRTQQIRNGNIDLRWTGNISKTATSKYRISYCASIHYFFGRHLFYIINFGCVCVCGGGGGGSIVYFLIVCVTGVVKIIFKCRKRKNLLRSGIPKFGSSGKYVFALNMRKYQQITRAFS